ncbi:uncharacterized protein LOC112040878 isoform X3 [Quercus suber]|uniref:uncharacterized protein LOC112040878 isoform X3 n=1 Tax=Quercus suber TaxID=58331 RepID=UPI0032DF8B99
MCGASDNIYIVFSWKNNLTNSMEFSRSSLKLWQIDSSGEFDDSVRVIWNSSRNLHNFFFSLFEGCLTFPVAHKSNIMWVVTYAQVAGLSFSTSVSNIFENQRVDKSGCLSTIVGEPFIYLMSYL